MQGQHSYRGPLGEPVRTTVYGMTQAEVRKELRRRRTGVLLGSSRSVAPAHGP